MLSYFSVYFRHLFLYGFHRLITSFWFIVQKDVIHPSNFVWNKESAFLSILVKTKNGEKKNNFFSNFLFGIFAKLDFGESRLHTQNLAEVYGNLTSYHSLHLLFSLTVLFSFIFSMIIFNWFNWNFILIFFLFSFWWHLF